MGIHPFPGTMLYSILSYHRLYEADWIRWSIWCHWMGRTINLISSTLPDDVELTIKLNSSPIRIWKSSYVSTKTEPELRKKRQKQFAKKFLVLTYLTRSTAQTLQADQADGNQCHLLHLVAYESQDLAGINAPWPVEWTISLVMRITTAAKRILCPQ